MDRSRVGVAYEIKIKIEFKSTGTTRNISRKVDAN